MDLKNTYNKIAKEWHKQHETDTWWVDSTDYFISLIGSGGSVLDVGCGAGTTAKYLTEHEVEVTGVDFSEKMIEIAKEVSPLSKFHVMTFKDAGNIKDTFDGLFMQASLLHVAKSEVKNILTGLSRLLKPGGYFYVAVKERREGQVEEEEKTEIDIGYEYKRFFSYFTRDELERYFVELGMKEVHFATTPSGKTIWLQMIFKKLENH